MSKKRVDDARIIELYASGLTLEKVGKEVGRSLGYVHRALVRNNVPRRPSVYLAKVGLDVEQVSAMYAGEKSTREIAVHFGIAVSTVREFMKANGIARRSSSAGKRLSCRQKAGRGRGEVVRKHSANGRNLLLTDEQVIELRAMDRRGVSNGAARKAADGETYGHIPIPVFASIPEVAHAC